MSTSVTPSKPSEYDDYRNPSILESVFQRESTIIGTADHFDIAPSTARKWLIRYGFYSPESDGVKTIAQRLASLDPDDVNLDGADDQ